MDEIAEIEHMYGSDRYCNICGDSGYLWGDPKNGTCLCDEGILKKAFYINLSDCPISESIDYGDIVVNLEENGKVVGIEILAKNYQVLINGEETLSKE